MTTPVVRALRADLASPLTFSPKTELRVNLRSSLGTAAIIVGLFFSTLALCAFLASDATPRPLAGAILSVAALASLATGWRLLLEAGTPRDLTAIVIANAATDETSTPARLPRLD